VDILGTQKALAKLSFDAQTRTLKDRRIRPAYAPVRCLNSGYCRIIRKLLHIVGMYRDEKLSGLCQKVYAFSIKIIPSEVCLHQFVPLYV
jgi:hypothetical protein